MATKASKPTALHPNALTSITIEGFKSIKTATTLELGALNVLAGANSAGKSSFMQPLLLLKQTLEAPYDPGPLLIDGPNVQFTEFEQFFSRSEEKQLRIDLSNAGKYHLHFDFGVDKKEALQLDAFSATDAKGKTLPLKRVMEPSDQQLLQQLRNYLFPPSFHENKPMVVQRKRSFLRVVVEDTEAPLWQDPIGKWLGRGILHIAGLRGNPERSYKRTAVGTEFPGRFDAYVASIIDDWQEQKHPHLDRLGEQLQALGLTWKIQAKKLGATGIELQVGRLASAHHPSHEDDLVSIADVGFGVSQVLPVLVALLVAKPGQLVYIEQPEIHLHPKAQRALAGIFAAAIHTGVQVVVETHSTLFLRAIQTLIAQGQVDKSSVKLHWVTRDAQGHTQVQSADLDDAGAYGDWPQDFDETESQAATDYYEAAEAVLFRA